jgi:hypothetical protein
MDVYGLSKEQADDLRTALLVQLIKTFGGKVTVVIPVETPPTTFVVRRTNNGDGTMSVSLSIRERTANGD